ncbi:MAG: DUF1499 domain-containing protein [Micropepsaceae bacterium]
MAKWIGRIAIGTCFLALVLIGGAGPLYRYAGIELPMAFQMLTVGLGASALAVLVAVVALVRAAIVRSGEGLVVVLLAAVVAAGVGSVPLKLAMTAKSLPVIHDITTDTASPPAFVAIAPIRANAPNGVDYATDPAEQQKGYPDIKSYVSTLAPAALFENAEAVAKELKWEIVASSRGEGRIEATDTTAWWGFKDDVVIRIVAEGTGSKLDIRSMSRVGKSDLGKNADRIRTFLALLSKKG